MTPVLGLDNTTPTQDPAQWAEMMSSAVDVARMWRYVFGLPAADREFVLAPPRRATCTRMTVSTSSLDSLTSRYRRRSLDRFAVRRTTRSPTPPASARWSNRLDVLLRDLLTLDSAGLPYPGSRVVALLTSQPMTGGWSAASARVPAAALAAVQARAPTARLVSRVNADLRTLTSER